MSTEGTKRREESVMDNIIQKLIEGMTKDIITNVVNKIVERKARQVAQKEGQGWEGSFHSMVSGYYTGLSFQYLGIILVVVLAVSMTGMWLTGDREDLWIFFTIMVLFLVVTVIMKRRMRVVVYWSGGILFLDRKGNEIVQMPSMMLHQAVIKRSKIIIPWEGKRYIIYRNVKDNEQDVREMLAFYGIDPT